MNARRFGHGSEGQPARRRIRRLDRSPSGRSFGTDGPGERQKRRRDPEEVVWDWEDADTDDELDGYDLDFADELEIDDIDDEEEN